jgi:hypothetical protein
LFVDDLGAPVVVDGATCGNVTCTGADCAAGASCVQADDGGDCLGVAVLLDGDDTNDSLVASLLCDDGASCVVQADGSESCVANLGDACAEPGESSCEGNVLRVCAFNADLFFTAPFGIDCGLVGDGFVCAETADGADCVGPASSTVGSLDLADDQYARPFTSCTVRDRASAFSFETWSVTNDGDTTATVTISTSDVGDETSCSFDSVVFAHDTPFNPADASASCVDGNDDAIGSTCSELTFTVLAGESVSFVVTSFDEGDTFEYQLNVDAPAGVTVSR